VVSGNEPTISRLMVSPLQDCYKFSSRTSRRWLIDRLFAAQLAVDAHRIGGCVLDVGCGDRRYLKAMPSHGYIGVDLRAPAEVIGEACRLPIASATVDTALCFQVLDDQPVPIILLNEIHRVLKPHGTLLLSADLSWRVHNAPRDYFRFTHFGLEYLLGKAYFTVDSIRPLGGMWALMANRFVYRFHDAFGKYRVLRPLVSLLGFAILNLGLVFDKLDFRDEDTQGYFVSATKLP